MTINRITHLLEITKTTAKDLTQATKIASSAISEWKKGKASPSADAIVKIAKYFSVPVDYLLETGVYENWDEIIQHKDSIWYQVNSIDFRGIYLSTEDGKSVSAIFYEALYTEPDDLKMIRLFSWAVKRVRFITVGNEYDDYHNVEAVITYSEGLTLLIDQEADSEPVVRSISDLFDEFMGNTKSPKQYVLSLDEWKLVCLYRMLNDYGKGEVMNSIHVIASNETTHSQE